MATATASCGTVNDAWLTRRNCSASVDDWCTAALSSVAPEYMSRLLRHRLLQHLQGKRGRCQILRRFIQSPIKQPFKIYNCLFSKLLRANTALLTREKCYTNKIRPLLWLPCPTVICYCIFN